MKVCAGTAIWQSSRHKCMFASIFTKNFTMNKLYFFAFVSFLLWVVPVQTLFAQGENPTEPDINNFVFVSKAPEPINLNEIKAQIGYPPEALEADVAQTVIARVLVDTMGLYVKHKITKGHPLLNSAVEAKLPEIVFTPAEQSGKKIMFWVNIPFSFKITDPEFAIRQEIRGKIGELTQQIELDPEDYIAVTNRGLRYLSLREYDKAISDFDLSLSINPKKNKKKKSQDYPYLFYAELGKGKAFLAQEKWEEAREELNKAINFATETKNRDSAFLAALPTAYAERGSAAYHLDALPEALNDYQTSLASATGNLKCDIASLQYEAAVAAEDYTQTIAALDILLACDFASEQNSLMYNRGYYKLKVEDFAGAVSDFDSVLAYTESSFIRIAAHNQKAMAYLGLGDSQKALDAVSKSMDINLLHPQAYFFRAKIRLQMDAQANVCDDLEKAITYGIDEEAMKEVEKLQAAHCEKTDK